MKASNSKGDARTVGYEGGKIHAAVTDDGIPVAIAYTSASLHDSQAMIPSMKKASGRVPHIHDLADAAYDSETIRESSVEEGNQPIIDCNRRKADEAVCHALLNGMPGNGHETQRRPRRVASLVIPFGGILCYKHWKMAFFSYGTMPLHASTDAEHEFMNCLYSS